MQANTARSQSDFRAVYNDSHAKTAFLDFLRHVYNIYPEQAFHTLIADTTAQLPDDRSIYTEIQHRLPSIKPFLSDIRYGLPALRKQKREMQAQTKTLMGVRSIDGYLEIGSMGRYVGAMRELFPITGPVYVMDERHHTFSPQDIVERGRIRHIGTFVPLDDYAPISESAIASGSLDFVSCFIGLHHAPLDRLDAFVASIRRILRPGGCFLLRDHDVTSPGMAHFVSLAHAVFNAGLNVSWAENAAELRLFRTLDEWIGYLADRGFSVQGPTLFQNGDPSKNGLLLLIKNTESAHG